MTWRMISYSIVTLTGSPAQGSQHFHFTRIFAPRKLKELQLKTITKQVGMVKHNLYFWVFFPCSGQQFAVQLGAWNLLCTQC